MKTGWHTRATLIAAGLIISCTALGGPATAQDSTVKSLPNGKPLVDSNFQQAAPRGFGDRNNSWAQAMTWWRDALYVGTSRQTLCTSLYAVWQYVGLVVDQNFANKWFPYPPNDPDLSCAPDGADLSLQAEIWRWTPDHGGAWERVFQSPLALNNPGPGASRPAPTGKKVPYEIGFRGLMPFTEPGGKEALYAFGINSTVMWDRTKLPPPRILRSTDGITFTPIPQTPGTFLGNLPFNPDHSSFRSPVSYNGKLFVLSGPIFGQGSLIGSADPAKGDNAWFLASPPKMQFYELAVFNGWLYLGVFDPSAGYAVVKTRAEGPPPYQFITVVPSGAYLPTRPSRSVVSMHEYFGRLYVGTATLTEVIRINPDDTWDLVVGPPRAVPLPGGGSEWKYPISGLDAGFGHSLNDHAWQMDDPYNYLYMGTYNASIASKNDPVYGPLLRHNMGAHLYRTHEGWYYSPVTTNGFTDPSDPYGGRFDYGIRTMESTPQGVFLGTANDYYGLAIFRATTRGDSKLDAPDRVEIEPTRSGGALLSWLASKSALAYRIWRAEVHPIEIRDDVNFEAWNGTTGTKIPDTYVGPYEQIGTTQDLFFIDSTVQPGKRYMYYVTADMKKDPVSDPSNLVAFPLLTPPVTFAQLLHEVDRTEQRQRFKNPDKRLTDARQLITSVRTLAVNCQLDAAIKQLDPNKASKNVLEPEATDLEILTAKLVRRLQLFSQFRQDVSSDEFCTYQ